MVKLENGYLPETLAEALEIRAAEKVVPYAGGTDLMVEAAEEATYLGWWVRQRRTHANRGGRRRWQGTSLA